MCVDGLLSTPIFIANWFKFVNARTGFCSPVFSVHKRSAVKLWNMIIVSTQCPMCRPIAPHSPTCAIQPYASILFYGVNENWNVINGSQREHSTFIQCSLCATAIFGNILFKRNKVKLAAWTGGRKSCHFIGVMKRQWNLRITSHMRPVLLTANLWKYKIIMTSVHIVQLSIPQVGPQWKMTDMLWCRMRLLVNMPTGMISTYIALSRGKMLH